MEEWISLKDELPVKGVDVRVKQSDDSECDAFRCACHNENCKEWRCTITGFGLMIDVAQWRPLPETEKD